MSPDENGWLHLHLDALAEKRVSWAVLLFNCDGHAKSRVSLFLKNGHSEVEYPFLCWLTPIKLRLSSQSGKQKAVKQILSDFSLVSAFAFIALVVGCAHTQQTENLLSAAGFRTVIATTPQQQQHLKTLRPYKVMRVQRNGKTHYVYADPAHNLIYVGGLFQYDQYRDLRLAKNVAAEDLQDAKLNAEDEMGWQVWGPFY